MARGQNAFGTCRGRARFSNAPPPGEFIERACLTFQTEPRIVARRDPNNGGGGPTKSNPASPASVSEIFILL